MLDSLNGWHNHLAEVYQHFKYSIELLEHDLLRGLHYPKKPMIKHRAVWYTTEAVKSPSLELFKNLVGEAFSDMV